MTHFSPSPLLDTLRTYPTSPRLWIAYSGGLDSHVLLHAFAQLRSQLLLKNSNGVIELRAIHIHHGLQPQADEWVTHCQNVCHSLNIPCDVKYVHIPLAPRDSLEAQARQARYDALEESLAPGEVMLTAQHADDQAETVLLQMLRGAGTAGLAAMPPLSRLGKGWLGRPLLAYTRADLHGYAQHAQLSWIEDSSNANPRFARNFLRQEILPRLSQRWPSVSHTLGRVARHQAEASELMDILAQQDLQTCQGSQPDQLSLPPFAKLTSPRQRNVLRYWLKQLGLPLPSTALLQEIQMELLLAKEDRQPLVQWQGGEVRRYQNHGFAMPNLPAPPKGTLTWKIPESFQLPLGKLIAKEGPGLILPSGTELQIRFRQGGEKCRWQGHLREVKNLLQAAPLPPWLRDFIPLIYFENELIAIPTICVGDPWRTQPGEIGWEIQWDFIRCWSGGFSR